MPNETAIIIGAGPAGLTAALELLETTEVKPIVLESTGDIGGISKTIEHNGNRIDIGGHRFFSKSTRVMDWWRRILPLQGAPSRDDLKLGRSIPLSDDPRADPEKTDNVMLVRERLSRIYFLRSFFDYPISLSLRTVKNLGFHRMLRIGLSYFAARLKPIKPEKSLEDFFVNRFGRELYLTFFRDYTEKVWGVPCDEIRPEWGAQRIKGLSVSKAVFNAVKSLFVKDASIEQKSTETSLIRQFMYPKFGPGQLWERVAVQIQAKGGEIHLHHEVTGIETVDKRVTGVVVTNGDDGGTTVLTADYVFSSMPARTLMGGMRPPPPAKVKEVSNGLKYRDFITVGLLVKRLKIRNGTGRKTINDIIPDNWMYIQERDVKLGRLQIFNNWSPYMVKDENTVWLGLEYFCDEGDALWDMADDNLIQFAARELAKIDVIYEFDVLDGVAIRMPKAYPAYFGSYDHFHVIRQYVDQFENLFLIGRNGAHSYNNQDHSMLSAMEAVRNVKDGVIDKTNIWSVNTETDYHEQPSTGSDPNGQR